LPIGAAASEGKLADTSPGSSCPRTPEVRLSDDLEAKLSRLAIPQGRDSESLVAEAVQRMVDDNEWFIGGVEKSLAQIENKQTLSHEALGERRDKHNEQRQSHR
jgi:predicted transcriptional regulator